MALGLSSPYERRDSKRSKFSSIDDNPTPDKGGTYRTPPLPENSLNVNVRRALKLPRNARRAVRAEEAREKKKNTSPKHCLVQSWSGRPRGLAGVAMQRREDVVLRGETNTVEHHTRLQSSRRTSGPSGGRSGAGRRVPAWRESESDGTARGGGGGRSGVRRATGPVAEEEPSLSRSPLTGPVSAFLRETFSAELSQLSVSLSLSLVQALGYRCCRGERESDGGDEAGRGL
ncbi:hypothetical protein HPB50_006545 [Hyalomma asiaticum]|uniref:Uncharacterized protein n=1 Tax=Hyalomma asiaticum TaxID=266040 RepID=A0ACB7T1G3_HYAAI|nr:hypothetical protein HPB50_006545 [Hyalomma asiaticum]